AAKTPPNAQDAHWLDAERRAQGTASAPQPLGQSRSYGRARVRRALVVGLERVARDCLTALRRIRESERLTRHQRRGAHQRERQRASAHATVPRQGRRNRRRLQTVRHQGISYGSVQRPPGNWGPEYGGP